MQSQYMAEMDAQNTLIKNVGLGSICSAFTNVAAEIVTMLAYTTLHQIERAI